MLLMFPSHPFLSGYTRSLNSLSSVSSSSGVGAAIVGVGASTIALEYPAASSAASMASSCSMSERISRCSTALVFARLLHVAASKACGSILFGVDMLMISPPQLDNNFVYRNSPVGALILNCNIIGSKQNIDIHKTDKDVIIPGLDRI